MTLCKLPALAADLVPWKFEDGIDRLETATGGFRKEEPDPGQAQCRDYGKEEHGAAGSHTNEHLRYCL